MKPAGVQLKLFWLGYSMMVQEGVFVIWLWQPQNPQGPPPMLCFTAATRLARRRGHGAQSCRAA
jgi:hypothetical protein